MATPRRNFNDWFVKLTLRELTDLMYWASIGIGYARSGTRIEETRKSILALSKKFRLQIDTPKIGKWRTSHMDLIETARPARSR